MTDLMLNNKLTLAEFRQWLRDASRELPEEVGDQIAVDAAVARHHLWEGKEMPLTDREFAALIGVSEHAGDTEREHADWFSVMMIALGLPESIQQTIELDITAGVLRLRKDR